MGGWGSFGYNEAEQQSQQSSNTGLRGTGYEGKAAKELYNRGQQLNNVSDMFMGNIKNDPLQWMRAGQSLLPGGKYGMGENADNAVAMLGQDLFSRGSGDAAARGQLSPESRNAVVGSALQNASVQLIPQIQAFQQAQFLAPQTLQQAAMTSADFWNRALGAQSSGTSSGNSFGFNFAGGGGATG